MDHLYIYIMALILGGLILYYLYFSRKAVVHGVISKTPAKKIAEISDGEEVRISGKVVYLGRTITAPLSKRKCVYYHVIVKDNSGSKEIFRNNINLEEEKAADIVITDGEHYAVIDTRLVAAYINRDHFTVSGFWNITTPELKAFLAKHGERTSDYIGWSLDLEAEEGILEEGEKLTLAGKASWREASDFRLKIPAGKILYIEPLNEHGVYLTDSPYL